MRFIHGILTHEFLLIPTIRYDNQYVVKYFEFDWLKFYVGVAFYSNEED